MNSTDEYLNKISELTNDLMKQEIIIFKTSKLPDFHNLEDSKTLTKLRNGIRENSIISLYTIWESFVKGVIFETIFYNQGLLNNDYTLTKMISKVNSNNFLSSSFYKLEQNNIVLTKNVLTHSNNMSMNAFYCILEDFKFERNDLFSHINIGPRTDSFSKITLNQLKVNAPINTIDSNDNLKLPRDPSDLVKFYHEKIFELVKFRNIAAHSDNRNEIWSLDSISTMADILKSLMITIDEYLIGQIIKRTIALSSDTDGVKKINTTNVYPKYSALEINPPENIRGRNINDFIFFAKDRQRKIFREIKVEKLKNLRRNTCKNIPKTGLCSVQINAIDLWSLKKNKEELYIYKGTFNKHNFVINVTIEDLF